MKKYFIASDIHGFYDEWMKALDEKGFDIENEDHIIVVLGDLLDRGPGVVKCLEFVNGLKPERKILIRGNHEDLMEEAMLRGYFKQHDLHNRTHRSCYQIVDNIIHNVLEDDNARKKFMAYYGIEYNPGDIIEPCEEWMPEDEILKITEGSVLWEDYIQWCVDYAEVGNNIFVHGWIPCLTEPPVYGQTSTKYYYFPDWKVANPYEWGKASWLNGMEAWSKGVREKGKTIWCGHWHCSWGNANLHNDGVEFLKRVETMYINPDTGRMEPYANYAPFKDDGIVAMDACTAWSGIVNCEVLEI